MRRQRKTREREKSLPNLAFSQILRIGQHGGTRPKRRTHPTRVCVFPLTLSFPRYFIFPAWFASSPTQFLILSRSLCARGGKRKGKKDIGKNEKRGKGKRKGAKIKRAVNGKQIGRLGRTNRIIRASFRFSEQTSPPTRFPVDPSKLVAEIGPSDFLDSWLKRVVTRHFLHCSRVLPLSRDFAIRSPSDEQLFRSGPLFLISVDPIFSKYLLSVFSKPRLLAEEK